MYVLPDILLSWLAVGLSWETDVIISSASSRSIGASSWAYAYSYKNSSAAAFSSTATYASSIFLASQAAAIDAALDF